MLDRLRLWVILTTYEFVLSGGVLLLVVLGLLLWRWRTGAIQPVIPPDRQASVRRARDPAEGRLPQVRGRLLWLLVQRGSQPPAGGSIRLAPEVVEQAKALLAERHKIEAIKLVRERTGWGLKESKDFVDGLD